MNSTTIFVYEEIGACANFIHLYYIKLAIIFVCLFNLFFYIYVFDF